MERALYYYSKILKKIRGSSIKNSTIDPTSKIESGSNIIDVVMNRYSFCGYDCEIVNCEIGAFTSVANNVIIGGVMHPMNWVSMSPVFYAGRDSIKKKFSLHQLAPVKKTYIGNDVWIGQYAMIKQGINVGHGAVIGMGSVVTKDVEPYSIVAGSPAKLLRKRFDEEIINDLIKIQWWNYCEDDLEKYSRYFTNPLDFIKEVKK